MGTPRIKPRARAALLALALGTAAHAAEPYSPGVGGDFPKNVFFGDLHLHTRNSPDAFAMGDTGLSAADAFRFARGEEVVSSTGIPARLRRPYDFLAVTDHAEFIGIYYAYHLRNPVLMNSALGRQWAAMESQQGGQFSAFVRSIQEPDATRDAVPPELARSIWRDVARTADEFNAPGRFTAFSGYEWTSMTGGNNLHRCIIFKDGWQTVSRVLPFSAQQSLDAEDLWAALAGYEQQTGGEVLAVPHNGNLSNGLMWDTKKFDGSPLDADYARKRMRWEPVAEVTQIKGDSETHPLLSPNDEFAGFERWDRYNIMGSAKTTPAMLPGSHARSALKTGLGLERTLGVNPYKFGMIGSTDDHTSLTTAQEDNFFGKFANSEPGAGRTDSHMAGQPAVFDWQLGASGVAAVWAEENTRESLFRAMKRKEVYATTGSRILLRFFGGWDFAKDVVTSPDFARTGYAKGVPMGGDLASAPKGKAPVFMVLAQKDSEDANLDRVQIVKGWVRQDGTLAEKVFDVALSDGRRVDPATGKAPPVGSTVDVANAAYTNTIGAAELSATWTDPDFDATRQAFYYARVLEIPKPRWTAYDAKYFGAKFPQETPMVVQDRAYSSPIWYTP